jgi:hypothetical protein
MQEILMNTHTFWREIQQTKWHFWEERRVLPFEWRLGCKTCIVYTRLKINVTTQFYPRDVVTTTAGHIIVSDHRSNALHVLSEQGDILTCKVMEDTGIEYPLSLDIDMRGQLWVGCGKESGATIHKVNIL